MSEKTKGPSKVDQIRALRIAQAEERERQLAAAKKVAKQKRRA